MFKKSLPVGMIFIFLLVAIATMGLSYGYWTDSLAVNGTVVNGELDVEFTNLWWSDNNCTYKMDPTSHTLTITADKAYPGFWCEGSVQVKNTGTIPVKIMAPVVTQTGPGYWDVYTFSAPVTLNPGDVDAKGVGINFMVPTSEVGNEGATSTLSITLAAQQVNAP
jgi:hypothetical protein